MQTTNAKRIKWPDAIVNSVLLKCHHRCCICPEHRRVSNIHHVDHDSTNSIESNAVALCSECHTEVHTTSTMRRNITATQVLLYKDQWEKSCLSLSIQLTGYSKQFTTSYYINAHRLDSLYRDVFGKNIIPDLPFSYEQRINAYNSLWPNPKNSLTWTQLAENRSFLEIKLREILSELVTVTDLNLIELGAIDAETVQGSLVSFSCQFEGKDIPEQAELVREGGVIDGPKPTMRRTITDFDNDLIIESCLMLDMQYMFADSAFIAFSEHGLWTGVARLIQCRDAIGSNDGHIGRKQLILSPICINNPVSHDYVTNLMATSRDPELEYLNLPKKWG